jgi:membrane protein DedA with SNARE-associated domain
MARSEMFFARYGDKTVLAARFILGLRTWGSMLAGMSRMPFWRFQLFSAIGTLVWAFAIGLIGYLLGNNLPLILSALGGTGTGGFVLAVFMVVTLIALLWRAARR